jgi:hypothetical protein
VGFIDVPTAVGALRVTGVGSWFSDALHAASGIATRVVNDPIVKSIMPPQAAMAIQAIQTISHAANRGAPALRAVMKQFNGPGKQRLVKALHKEAVHRDRVDPLPAPPDYLQPSLESDEEQVNRLIQSDEDQADEV